MTKRHRTDDFLANTLTWDHIIERYDPSTVNNIDPYLFRNMVGWAGDLLHVNLEYYLPAYLYKNNAVALHAEVSEAVKELISNKNVKKMVALATKYALIDTQAWCRSNAAKLAALRDYTEVSFNTAVVRHDALRDKNVTWCYPKNGYDNKYIAKWYKKVNYNLEDRVFLHPYASYHRLLPLSLCSLLARRAMKTAAHNTKGSIKVLKSQTLLVFVLPIKRFDEITEEDKRALPPDTTLDNLKKEHLNFHFRTFNIRSVRNHTYIYNDNSSVEYKYGTVPLSVTMYTRNNKGI